MTNAVRLRQMNMFTLGLALGIAAVSDDTVVITLKGSRGRGKVFATVFTNDQLVAGYACDDAMGHGATTLSTPFVWHRGVLHNLPTGNGEYARVFAGNDHVLIGEASTGPAQRGPAKWTADPQMGWAKAKLEILGEAGFAIAVTPDGTIWVDTEEQVYSIVNGKVDEKIDAPRFDLVGIDRWGRIWGNRYQSLAPGGSRIGRSAVTIENGKFVEIQADVLVFDVNLDAVAIGEYSGTSSGAKEGPIILANGRLVEPRLPVDARLKDINEKGLVLGEVWKGTGESSRPIPFTYAGSRKDLMFADLEIAEVKKMSDDGSILYSKNGVEGFMLVLRPAR